MLPIITALALLAGPVQALDLSDCKRTTHPSHGGQIRHADLGEGRVIWMDWWSQEGAAKWLVLVDCADGAMLRFMTSEENMGRRAAFDRTDDALAVIDRHQSGARIFATFPRMAGDLAGIARDITITVEKQETCACAAAYPALRGDKIEFTLVG